MTPEEKLALIRDQLEEPMRFEIIENIVLKENRPVSIYWGTATTGRPHCGYFVPMMKIAQFLAAGCRVKILLADIHGFLDNLKAPIELVNYRAKYYKFVIQALLRAIGVSLDKLEFPLGSTHQLTPKYTMDLYRLSTMVTEHDAKKAGAEVVKQSENAPLSGLMYPLMQSLDEEHLDVDAQFGGVDQRKIFALATETLSKIGYKTRAHLMNPMVPGLAGGKMSASDPDSKIDILDTADVVQKKLKKAFAAPGEIEGNGIVAFVKYVLLPLSALRNNGKASFTIEQHEGQPLVYHDIKSLEDDYRAQQLTPQLLKSGASAALVDLLAPIQVEYQNSPEWQEIEKKAYPPPPEKQKKKPKNKGTRFPGNVAAKPDGSVEGKDKDQVDVGHNAAEAMSNLAVNGEKA